MFIPRGCLSRLNWTPTIVYFVPRRSKGLRSDLLIPQVSDCSGGWKGCWVICLKSPTALEAGQYLPRWKPAIAVVIDGTHRCRYSYIARSPFCNSERRDGGQRGTAANQLRGTSRYGNFFVCFFPPGVLPPTFSLTRLKGAAWNEWDKKVSSYIYEHTYAVQYILPGIYQVYIYICRGMQRTNNFTAPAKYRFS